MMSRMLTDAGIILTSCRRAGLRLWRDGDRIAVAPARLCPPELLASLREHKKAVLNLLETEATHLTPDCVPWVHVARQILDGEFVGCDGSTRASLVIGLQNIRHPLCQRAVERLRVKRNT